MKYYRWSEDHVYHGISYPNLLMYMAVIPDYSLYDDDKPNDKEEVEEKTEPLATKEALDFFKDL